MHPVAQLLKCKPGCSGRLTPALQHLQFIAGGKHCSKVVRIVLKYLIGPVQTMARLFPFPLIHIGIT
ncbi:hypothetical protein D3C81_2075740 [compost metagenome]